jgi:hypothetical protein
MVGLLPEQVIWRKVKMGFPFPLRVWLPANKGRFFDAVKGLDCPYLDLDKLAAGYDEIARRDEGYLWRVMSTALWWKKSVQQESVGTNAVPERSTRSSPVSEPVEA